LKIGIVATNRREWHVKNLLKEFDRSGAETFLLPPNRFLYRIGAFPKISVREHGITDFDAIVIRKIPGGSPEQIFYRMDVLHMLEEQGVFVINPAESIEKAVNKFYTSALLEKASIRTVKTFVTEKFEEAMKAFEELGGEVVLKPLFGSLGKGITRINDPDIAYRVFKTLEMTRSVYYLQEFIPHGNEDIRAFVIGEKVIASMIRTAEDWKTNISSGGRARPHDLESDLAETCIEASRKIGLFYSGVDLLRSELDDRVYVTELNSTPGWQGLQTVSDRNITIELVEFTLQKI
jgi:ribosomal protein S6--L-glutamate ligase/tetrahydromethanopterin:alpha-L-glutamate ligase